MKPSPHRGRSIQFAILFAILAVTLLMMLLIWALLYNRTYQLAQNSATTTIRQLVNQINNNLDFYLQSTTETSNYLQQVIAQSKQMPDEDFGASAKMVMESRSDVVSVVLFSKQGEVVQGVPFDTLKPDLDVTREKWFTKPLEEGGIPFYSAPHVQNLFPTQHAWVVTVSRKVEYWDQGQPKDGVLMLDVKFSVIDDICTRTSLGQSGYVYLIDNDTEIVYHPRQQMLYLNVGEENLASVREHVFGRYHEVFKGRSRFISIETVNNVRWRIVGVAYMDEMTLPWQSVSNYLMLAMLMGVFLALFISVLVAERITRPIRSLDASMRMVDTGRMDISIKEEGWREVAQLSHTFNRMIARIRDLMAQLLREQEAKRKSELDALQSQINPHFLYNTLDSVVHMQEAGNTEEAVRMVTSLSRLFRISISKGQNIIAVRDELEHARHYLTIQKIRYKNRFDFDFQVQPGVEDLLTLKLIIQPVIENAIYHGVEMLLERGQILIGVSVDEDTLLYEVIDNGVGMEQEQINRLLEGGASFAKRGNGIGVKNVHERIRLYYGSQFGLSIQSEVDMGTIVQLRLPIQHAQRGANE